MEYTMEDWQCNQEYDWPSVDDYQMLNYDRLERERGWDSINEKFSFTFMKTNRKGMIQCSTDDISQ